MNFKLVSDFKATGDQPNAIEQLSTDLNQGNVFNVLHGATGTGKTFTIANVIEKQNRPTLIISHNKTLAAQLYLELKNFFPDNLIEYYISDFDYYQPEAYMPVLNRYIAKESMKNEKISKMRLSTISALKSNRRDVIVVASVSCIFGAGNPEIFQNNILKVEIKQTIKIRDFLKKLTYLQYHRDSNFKNSTFRVLGDQVDIYSPFKEQAFRVVFWGDEIQELKIFDPKNGKTISKEKSLKIFPADMHILMYKNVDKILKHIKTDLKNTVKYYKEEGLHLEANRLKERTEFDIEMIQEIGYCQGIENYSRYLDDRLPGTPPHCLIDYFPDDYLMVIDESHVTLPQFRAMYASNYSMKKNLIEYGFRLPSAFDNRPLKFDEFEDKINQVVYVSATPANYELTKTEGYVIEQLIRPTGLLDPKITVKPTKNQIDDFFDEIDKTITNRERVLVTTLSIRMAEELSNYLVKANIKSCYLHSHIKPIDRVDVLDKLQTGEYDVLVGVNLLREGLDLPQVSLVVIFDADKEGFLRNQTSMIQTIGRAARNVNGRVIMYADKITNSMEKTIDETNRRRKIQHQYNLDNNITPTTIKHNIEKNLQNKKEAKKFQELPIIFTNINDLKTLIKHTKIEMEKAAKDLNFIEATSLRDRMFELEKKIKTLQ